jgi:sugar diacid utilization regulator
MLATIAWETLPEAPAGLSRAEHGPLATLSVRSKGSSPETVAEAVSKLVDVRKGGLTVGRDDVRVWLPYQSADQWNRSVRALHVRMSADLGRVSIGHAFQRCLKYGSATVAMIHAAEAALIGDRFFGHGHLTSYAEAQLARLVLEHRDASDLGAVYERAIGNLVLEDSKPQNGLVRTLEVYCNTLATARTAEELGVHRNTVLHRLKRIEEITATDLEDASTRLLVQLGLVADRLLRKVDATSIGRRVYVGAGVDAA